MSYSRLLGAWLVLAVAMPLNGVFRELVMKPRIPHGLADIVSAVLGVGLILGITRWIFRIPSETPVRSLAAVSVFLVILTIAFEFSFGLAEGRTVAELLENYAIWRGRLWPIVLATLGATPFLWRGRITPRTRSTPSPPARE